MPDDSVAAYPSMYTFLQMQLQVDAEYDLHDEHEHQEWCEGSVYIMGELATTMAVSKEVADNRENDTKDLEGYVPP